MSPHWDHNFLPVKIEYFFEEMTKEDARDTSTQSGKTGDKK